MGFKQIGLEFPHKNSGYQALQKPIVLSPILYGFQADWLGVSGVDWAVAV